VAQFNRLQKMEDKCGLCFKSSARNPDLAIAVGQSSYLALPARGKLVQGHCCIVTQEHTPSMRQVNGDGMVGVWQQGAWSGGVWGRGKSLQDKCCWRGTVVCHDS
jgi:hypothetical protein